MPDLPHEPACADCVAHRGLCHFHARELLPQLAINLGWLWLIGEALCEQKRLQHAAAEHTAAIEKAKRRESRKRFRHGKAGLLAHIATAA